MDAIAHVPDVSEIAHLPGVSQIATYVITFIKDQIGYISSYEENLEKLMTEVQTLEDTQVLVKHRVAEAERNGDKIENIVQNWLKNANDIVAEAKKVIDVEGATWCLGRYCPSWWIRCQLSKRFEETTKKITDLIEKGKFDKISYREALDVTTTPFSRGYEALESRTSILSEIKEILKDPEMYMIGVHGMGGVGKTTLVNELAWQVRKDELFGVVAIADITNSPDVKKIQGQIADALDLKLEKESERGRATDLRQRIKKEEKVLIILDDIWSELDLTEVGIPFGVEHNGCKLVITSREREVLSTMETKKDFNLTALPEEDSWNLFQKVAGDVVNEVSIKPIAEEVAKCCAGLPLSITAVAKSLRKKQAYAWRDAQKQLKEFKHIVLENNVYPALKLSYDSLEKEELKSLFLFIGSFGLSEILTEDLLICCWGLGFYGGVDKLMEARDKHYTFIDELRDSSLLLEGELGWVRMHDVVRDVAKSIASKSPATDLTYSTYADQFSRCHYIISESLTEVRDDNFFSGMGEVMTLSVYEMSFIPFLPSLNPLISLRSLNLNSCRIGDIRIVAELSHLEILSLAGSSIQELPGEIKRLTRLRLLNLTYCDALRVIPKRLISSLTCLEELYMGGCDGIGREDKGRIVRELLNLHDLTTLEISLEYDWVLPMDFQFPANLKRYNLLVSDHWQTRGELSSIWYGGALERTLKLTDYRWTSRSLFTTVEDLSFAQLNGVKDLYDLDVKGFPQLKHLYIQDTDELLHLINPRRLVNPHSAFLNLETLVLDYLSEMEEICHGPMQTQSFAKLKVIKVTSCDGLKNLFLYSLTANLSQLHEIEISSCRGMTEIIAVEKQEDQKELLQIDLPELHSVTLRDLPELQSFYCSVIVDQGNPSGQSNTLALFNQQVVTTKLETLKLYDMTLSKIWDDKLPVVSCFQNLASLIVDGCNHLISLFPSGVSEALVKLERVEISCCERMKAIFAQKEVQFPNSQTVEISIKNDRESIRTNQVPPNSFHHKLEIDIDRCKSMDFVILPELRAVILRDLPELQSLYCSVTVDQGNPSSQSIPLELFKQQVVTPKLETMKLYDLNLCKIWDDKLPVVSCFQNLTSLIVDGCNRLISLFPSGVSEALVKLERVEIFRCERMKAIFAQKEVQFSDSQTVEISIKNDRESIRTNQVPPNSFHHKLEIDIDRCKSMDFVILPELRAVILRDLPELQSLYCSVTVDQGNPSSQSIPLELFKQQVVTPKLETMKLYDLNLCKIWDDKLPVVSCFQNLTSLIVDGCNRLVSLFPSGVSEALVKLERVKISRCERMKAIFAQKEVQFPNSPTVEISIKIDRESIRTNQVPPNSFHHNLEIDIDRCKSMDFVFLPELHSVTLRGLPELQSFYCSVTVDQGNPSSQSSPLALFNQQVVTPKLETLELFRIDICKIWDDKLPLLSRFQNLKHLRVISCNRLTSLFPSRVTRALVNLEEVEISWCRRLKVIFSQEVPSEFPNSETVEISIMNDWESIRPNQVPPKIRPNSFHHNLDIDIAHCESMDFVIPTSAAKEFHQQHRFLKIRSCGIKNIVEKSDITCDMTHVYLEKITVEKCRGMKTIIPSFVLFQCLDELIVSSCHTLVNIIRPSTTTSLPNLRILRISDCDELEEIYGSSNEGDAPVLDEITFMKLEELTLEYLPCLTSFCQGNYSFNFPSLQMVHLKACSRMRTFCHGNLTTPSLTKVEYSWDFSKLSEDNWHMLNGDDGHMMSEDHWYGDLNTTVRTVFTKKDQYPDWEKLDIRKMFNNSFKSIWPNQVTPNSFPNLTKIVIDSCRSQYVFPIYVAKVLRQLQVLEISFCTIENIVEESDSTCDMMAVYLEVRKCHHMMTIVPSSVQFHSLDELHVYKCRRLKNIIMPSTIANLPNLRILWISKCDELEEIYGSNNESDVPLGEIGFMKLEELTLKYLPKLTSFCQGSYNFKFSSLQKVHLKECLMMETFCHGNLTTSSQIEVRCLYGWSNEESWVGDLNTTIRTIFTKENTEQDLIHHQNQTTAECVYYLDTEL